jgi:hypothetical protein
MKNKRFQFSITAMLLISTALWAFHPKEIENNEVYGIYLTLKDFRNNKLTIPTDKQHKGDGIKLNLFLISPEISVVEQDKKIVYYKDSIFAIQLSNGKNYRFINSEPCLIADTSYLFIYTLKTVKYEYKRTGPKRIAKEIPATYYYFSLPENQKILALNLDNILKTTSYQYSAISKNFSNNESLIQYNEQSKHFAINDFIISIIHQ